MQHVAYYNDGKTAARYDVSLGIQGDKLVITDERGVPFTTWPLADIRQAGTARGRPKRFYVAGLQARITLGTNDDGIWLAQHCLNLKKPDVGQVRWPVWAGAGALAVISVIGSLLFLIPNLSGWAANAIPPALEQRMGVVYLNQILQVASGARTEKPIVVCQYPAAVKTIQRHVDELAIIIDSPFPINVTVVRFPVANALTLPGGQIIVFSKLLEDAKSGDELMGVLAHEIAHVVRRDPLQVSMKRAGAALLVSLMVGDVVGGAALAVGASAILEGGYSRDAEAASDYLAVTALNQLGISARPLGDFLERMQKQSHLGNVIPEFLSTHPPGKNRAREIRRLSQAVGRSFNNFEWRTVKNMCKREG